MRWREIRECGHRPAGVRAHPRPDPTVRSRGIPLPTEVIARLENGDVVAGSNRVLRGNEATGTGTDHGDPRPRAEPHHPRPPRSVKTVSTADRDLFNPDPPPRMRGPGRSAGGGSLARC